ncbi:MAG: hypothetical protein P1U88_16720 [Thalassobaculaceae bacterium]|nr:hypothetical protein [Thalassobaculaceae bacterium]
MLSTSALSPFLAIFLMAAQGHAADPAHDARREFAPAVIVPSLRTAPVAVRAPVPAETESRGRDSTRAEH